MSRIIIVEDKLNNGLRIAEQVRKWIVQEDLEHEIELSQIFLFKPTEEVNTAKEEYRQEITELGLNIEPICLWNFDEKLDECMKDVDEKTLLLIDYLLMDDGSDGVPEYRVNIRYARRQEAERKKRLFFYTLTGEENFEILCGLVGKEHVIAAKYEKAELPCLDLQCSTFRQAIQDMINTEMPLPEPYHGKHPKKTNADWIRSMTDEELAIHTMCPNDTGLAEIECDKSDSCNCYECLLNWLRAESEEKHGE